MRIGSLVRKVIKKTGNTYKVYDIDGSYLGEEKGFLNIISRSVDEQIAAFGRKGIFHNASRISYGVIIEDTTDGKKYLVGADRGNKMQDDLIIKSIYCIQVNAAMNVYRKEITSVDSNTGYATYELKLIYSNKDVYIEKKDWTMETITTWGRDQKGYETLVCQDYSLVDGVGIQLGDYIQIENKRYIVQDIDKILRERMLRIQLGLNTHEVFGTEVS